MHGTFAHCKIQKPPKGSGCRILQPRQAKETSCQILQLEAMASENSQTIQVWLWNPQTKEQALF